MKAEQQIIQAAEAQLKHALDRLQDHADDIASVCRKGIESLDRGSFESYQRRLKIARELRVQLQHSGNLVSLLHDAVSALDKIEVAEYLSNEKDGGEA